MLEDFDLDLELTTAADSETGSAWACSTSADTGSAWACSTAAADGGGSAWACSTSGPAV